jgi:Tfp pilus assembly protein PilW
MPQKVSSPINEDPKFQRATWVVERVAWVLMALIIVAALAGYFGGASSGRTVRDSTGEVQLDYERFMRNHTPSELKIKARASAAGSVSIQLGKALFEAVEVRSVEPQPRDAALHPDGPVYTFAASSEGESDITFTIIPTKVGSIAASIGIAGQPPVRTDIFVYP